MQNLIGVIGLFLIYLATGYAIVSLWSLWFYMIYVGERPYKLDHVTFHVARFKSVIAILLWPIFLIGIASVFLGPILGLTDQAHQDYKELNKTHYRSLKEKASDKHDKAS